MRQLLITGLGLFLLSVGLQATELNVQRDVNPFLTSKYGYHHSHSFSHEGPPGPMGPQGLPGTTGPTGADGIIAINYAAANDRTLLQTIVAAGTIRTIGFTENQVPPVGITHNISVDDTSFIILNEGFYTIGWLATLINPLFDIATIYLVYTLNDTLYNINGLPFGSDPGENFDPMHVTSVGGNTTVSGNTLAFLPAGAVLQFRVGSSTGGLQIDFPRLSIIQRQNL